MISRVRELLSRFTSLIHELTHPELRCYYRCFDSWYEVCRPSTDLRDIEEWYSQHIKCLNMTEDICMKFCFR